MSSLWIRVDPKSNDCPFIKQETTETQGRRSCEDRGRDGSDATRSQGMPGAIGNQKRQRRLSTSLWRKRSPANTRISDVWPPELRQNTLLLFQVTEFVVIRYGSPRKLIQSPLQFPPNSNISDFSRRQRPYLLQLLLETQESPRVLMLLEE